jgi:hypothetical protein
MAKQAHTDDQFLHTAANILRRDIHNLDIKNDVYPAPSECSLSNPIQSMPPTLTKFICWLILISDINFSYAKSWSEDSVSSLTVSLGVFIKYLQMQPL